MTTSISDAGIQFADGTVQAGAALPQVVQLTATVAANTLTIVVPPISLTFRSTTLGSGATTVKSTISPSSITIPNTATLGTVNGVQSRLVVVAFDSTPSGGAGIELAVINITGGVDLTETVLMSTLAIAGGSNLATAFYSTTLRNSAMPYRVIGYVESTQATAGTWATPPSTVQGYGGQALAAMSSLGYGQNWQSVTRTSGTTYYNTTGKPITLSSYSITATAIDYTITVNGVQVARSAYNSASGGVQYVSAVIPPGASYMLTVASGGAPTSIELR